MSDKYLILSRKQKETANSEWYERGRQFLADNGCNKLSPIGEEPAVVAPSQETLFQSALRSVSMMTGGAVQIDPDADVFIVAAKTGGGLTADECKCTCGYGGSCGGGGGGGGRVRD